MRTAGRGIGSPAARRGRRAWDRDRRAVGLLHRPTTLARTRVRLRLRAPVSAARWMPRARPGARTGLISTGRWRIGDATANQRADLTFAEHGAAPRSQYLSYFRTV